MKKLTRTLALLLTICILLSGLSAFVSASSIISGSETMIATANIAATLEEVQADNTLSDTDKIQQIVTLLFDAKREQLANTDIADFDFSIFGEISGLQYFSRSVKAQKETYNALNLTLNNCQTDLTFDSIEINGDAALVNVYEWFSYYYNTLPDVESGAGIEYKITLQKSTAGWSIINIDFTNGATDTLKDTDISVSSFVQNRYEAANTVIPSSLVATFGTPESTATTASTANYIEFSSTKFLSYAMQYDGSARNPNFMDCSSMGGDCQNFASQCIWAGLGGETSSLTSAGIPMVNPTLAGSTGRAWYIFPNGTHSASWTSCTSFGNYISAGSSSTLGLHGSIYSGVAYAQIGDVIHIRNSSGTYYHAYVVVAVTGTWGSRTLSDVYVSAHTEDRSCELLSTIYDSDVYRTIHIRGLVSEA